MFYPLCYFWCLWKYTVHLTAFYTVLYLRATFYFLYSDQFVFWNDLCVLTFVKLGSWTLCLPLTCLLSRTPEQCIVLCSSVTHAQWSFGSEGLILFLLDTVPFNCQLCYKERQAWLSLSGNSDIRLDIATAVVGTKRRKKMGCAVGKTGIDGIRLEMENLKMSNDK